MKLISLMEPGKIDLIAELKEEIKIYYWVRKVKKV